MFLWPGAALIRVRIVIKLVTVFSAVKDICNLFLQLAGNIDLNIICISSVFYSVYVVEAKS